MSIFRGSFFNFGFEVVPKEIKEAARVLGDTVENFCAAEAFAIVRVVAVGVGCFITVLTIYHTERVTRAKGE